MIKLISVKRLTWLGEEHLLSYESLLASMEKRKLDLLMLSSDSDLWNLSQTPLPSSSSLCFLFLRLLRRSFALFELSLDVPEEDSEVGPPLPLYSPLSVAAAAATCQPMGAQTWLSWQPLSKLSQRFSETRVEERAWQLRAAA